MKTKIFMTAITFILMTSMNLFAQNKKENFDKTVTFQVSMTCENCKKTIEKNIAFEKGIRDMKVDLSKKMVTLTFDTRKIDEKKIISAFDKLGYDAVVVDSESVKKS